MIITYLTKDSYGACADSNYSANAMVWKGRLLEWQLFVAEASGPGGVSDYIGSYWDGQRDKVPDVVHDVLELEDTPSWMSDVELQINLEREVSEGTCDVECRQRVYVTRNVQGVYDRLSSLHFLWEGAAHHYSIEFGSKRGLRKVWDKFNAHFDHSFDGMLEQLYMPKEKAVGLHSLAVLKWTCLLQQHNIPEDEVRLQLCRHYEARIHYSENEKADLNPRIVTCLAELELWSRKLVACKNVLTYEQYLEWEDRSGS